MHNPTPYELYLPPGILAREAYDWMFKSLIETLRL